MNLHLLEDEKISSRIINTFNKFLPGKNFFICWRIKNQSPRFITKSEKVFIYENDGIFPLLDYTKFDKIIFHAYSIDKVEFCNNYIKHKPKFYWILWGWELYNILLINRGFQFSPSSLYTSIKKHIKFKLRRFLPLNYKERELLSFIKYNDFTMMSNSLEYRLLKSSYPRFTRKLKNAEYFYYPIDEILGTDIIDRRANGKTILLGNSCSYTNNHFYLFEQIKKLDFKNYKLVAPINYGGDKEYRDQVIQYGYSLFGDKFVPITEYLDLNKYNKLLLSVKYAFFGNWRQEAFGNIVILLYLGTKVFLSKKSPLYKILKKMNLVVFPLENIKQKDLFPLEEHDIISNRTLLLNKYNLTELKRLTLEFFE